MTRFATFAFVALVSFPVAAQEFKGKCTELTNADACKAVTLCRWSQGKAVEFNGKVIEPKGSCSFKKGFKEIGAELAKAGK